MPGKRYKRKGGGGGEREEKKRKTDGNTNNDGYTEIIKENSAFEEYYKVSIASLFSYFVNYYCVIR